MDRYYKFIDECRLKLYEGGTHRHHIIPRFMGGDDSAENKVVLGYDDHLHAHLILAECFPVGSKERVGNLASALYCKRWVDGDVDICGINNPFYGKVPLSRGVPRTEEVKMKISNTLRGRVISWGDKLKKPKRVTINMGRYDKFGDRNPNSKSIKDLSTGIEYSTILELRSELGISHSKWHRKEKHSKRFQVLEKL